MRPGLALVLSLATPIASPAIGAQNARAIAYEVVVDSAQPARVSVRMRVPFAPAVLDIAMAVHPEYDDRFYRYVRDVSVTRDGKPVAVRRIDSTLWRATGGDGVAEVKYRLDFPGADPARGGWRGFLTPTGGLIGGPHTFMYVVGRESAPATVTLVLPSGWRGVSGLGPAPSTVFRARDAFDLIDSPMMVGRFALSSFSVANVRHQIAWWDSADRTRVDPSVATILEALARAAHGVFGAFPYANYSFMIVGGVMNGGLEHRSSVSLGAPDSTRSAAIDFTEDAAHEYFHAWNEMALRPTGWGALSHRAASPNRLTWWMEGATMYYADVISRRARAPVALSDRRAQLETWLTDYFDNPGNLQISPESASVTTGMLPGANGDLAPDVYGQGRLVAAALDLFIQARTNDQRSLDDAMRALYQQRVDRGYAATDVSHAVGDACGCDAGPFFARYVRSAHPLDFDNVFRRLGWRLDVTRVVARDSAGAALPDTRVFAYTPSGDSKPRILIIRPAGAWAHAGLRTRDVVLRINTDSIANARDFYHIVRGARIGDTAQITYVRAGSQDVARVTIGTYERVIAKITELPNPTPEQALRRRRFQSAER